MTAEIPKIRAYQAPELYQKCADVTPQDNVQEIIEKMSLVVGADSNAMALAANQIAIMKRVVVMKPKTEGVPSVYINPVITLASEEKTDLKEGCLSFPGIFLNRGRSRVIHVKYQDINFEEHTVKLHDIEAVCLQHEIDHLNGVTMLSHLPGDKIEYWTKKSMEFVRKRYGQNLQRMTQRRAVS